MCAWNLDSLKHCEEWVLRVYFTCLRSLLVGSLKLTTTYVLNLGM